MAMQNFAGVIMDSVLGGGITARLTAWKRDELEHLRELIEDLRENIEGINAQAEHGERSPHSVVSTAETKITAIAENAAARLPVVAEQGHAARQSQTVFRVMHNLVRSPIHADTKKSAALFTALAFVEGVATALFFLNGGFVSGITEALGLGMTISSLNILLSGFLGGGFFGKYWAYGLKSRDDDPQITLKRFAGRVGCVFTALMIVTLLLSSGIVRATGETESLTYGLESIAAAATNFHALLLWGLGISFSILSWRKGMSAFSDPYPEFTRESEAFTEAQNQIHALFDDALEDIDDISEDAEILLDELAQNSSEAQQDKMGNLHEIRREREAVLSAIARASDDYAAFYAEQIELHRMVSGGDTDDMPPDAVFDVAELLAKVPAIAVEITAHNDSFFQARNEALKHLAITKKTAVQALSAAYQNALN